MKRTYLFVLVTTLLLSGCTQNNGGNTPVDGGGQTDQPSTSIDDGYRTVTFDTKGGTRIDPQRILLGEKIEKPADPAKEGNSFVTWTYDLEPWDFENGVVESDMVLEAQYTPNQYELLLAHYNNEEHGTITGNGTYTWGESVILNAVPDTGYIFAGWYKNEYKLLSTEPTYVYTMGVNQTLYARWDVRLNNLSVTSENEEQGTVQLINGSGYSDESITVKAIAKEGYSFAGWYHDLVQLSTEALYSFTMPTEDYSVVAKFISNEELLQRELGIIPTINNARNKITYGLYPQTVVTDENLIDNLNAIAEPEESNDYYLYNNHYYFPHNASVTGSMKFNNGDPIVNGKKYWYKCEALEWDILSTTSNLVYSSKIFQSSSNNFNANYKGSTIRSYYNDGRFMDNAFSLSSEYISPTSITVSGSSENVTDNVFLLTSSDLKNTNYGFGTNESRKADATDYAYALGLSLKSYFLRDNSSGRVYYVDTDGSITYSSNAGTRGIRLAMSLTELPQ